jgi:hypothetical protein
MKMITVKERSDDAGKAAIIKGLFFFLRNF